MLRGNHTVIKKGPDEMHWHYFEGFGPLGKPLPSSEMVFRRAKPMSFQDFQAYGEALVGEWQAEVILAQDLEGAGKKGDKVKSQGTITWGCDKRALIGQGVFGSVTSQGITRWDPETGQILDAGVDSLGALYQGKITREEGKWVYRGKITATSGKVLTGTDTLTIENGGNTHIHVGTDQMTDGTPQDGYRDVYSRVNK